MSFSSKSLISLEFVKPGYLAGDTVTATVVLQDKRGYPMTSENVTIECVIGSRILFKKDRKTDVNGQLVVSIK